ncbi:MAG: cytochrome P450 [Linnemannia elongata]|nr:MAG: cytochrome P450 [Linnemannia elongata]
MTLVALVEKATHQSAASLAVTLSAIVTYVLYKSWLYPFHLDPLSKIPGPSPSRFPFLGNMLALTKKKPMMALYDWAMEYPGSIYRYYWFSRLTLMTSDPVTVGYVLGKGNDNWLKSKGTEEMFEQNLGHSLLSMKAGEHAVHRKYLAKGFKHNYLKSMATAFHGVAQDLLGVWKERLDDKAEQKEEAEVRWEHDGKTYTTIDLEPSFYCLTLDSIGQFALGRGFDAIKSPIGPEFDNYRIIVDSFQVTLLTMLPLSNWIPTKTNRRAWSAVRAFNSSMEGIVQERKQKLLEEIKDHDGEFSQAEDATSQKKDFLTMLLVDQLIGEGGTDLQIRHDVFTAVFAGHETTSAALSWTFYQLACHPEIQARLREETRQLYKDKEGAPTYDELNSLPYLNAVIRESLRLWSPIPLNLRVSVEDDHLPRNNGLPPLYVRAGTNLQIPMFILQRDPKIWGPDSLSFNPSRWLTTDKASPCPPYSPPNGLCYFPFYHGKRSCVGNKIATLEMKTHIANLINTFEFVETPELRANRGEIDWRWSISLKPCPGVKLGVRLAD